MAKSLSVISINLRGLNDFNNYIIKISHIQKLNPDVVLAQETKIRKLKKFIWYKLADSYYIFEARTLTSKQGLMIAVKKTLVPLEKIKFTIVSPHICMITIGFPSPLSVFNVHSPNLYRQKSYFFNKLLGVLLKASYDVIIGGDWNIAGTLWEAKYNTLLKCLRLKDVAVELNKQCLSTRSDGVSSNRLDRMAFNLASVKKISYELKYCPGSDHLMVKVGFCWEMEEEYRKMMRKVPVLEDVEWEKVMSTEVETIASKIKKLKIDPLKKWQLLKADAYKISLDYGKKKDDDLQKAIRIGLGQLDSIINGDINGKRKREITAQVHANIVEENRRNRTKLELKLKRNDVWLRQHGSSLIIRRLKARKAKNFIYAMKMEETIKGDANIAEAYVKFLLLLADKKTSQKWDYERDLSKQRPQFVIRKVKNFLLPKEELLEPLDKQFCMDELCLAIKSTSKVATPGPDACPTVLYASMSPLQRTILLDFANNIVNCGTLNHATFIRINQAIVIPIVKQARQIHNVNDFRPIALMNSEIKIISKMCLSRLTDVVESMLPFGMSGIKGRSIQRALFMHYVSIALAKKSGLKSAFLLKLDVYKAFSTLDVEYLNHILIKYCGDNFTVMTVINLVSIKAIAVKINKYLTPMYELRHTILQGSPLSSLLYTLYLKELVELISFATRGFYIRGIRDPIKVINYIDDMTIMVRSDEEIKKVKRVLTNFQEITGTKINLEKSYVYDILKCKGKQDSSFKGLPGKILGVNFHKLIVFGTKSLFSDILDVIEKKVKSWSTRWMNWADRKDVINKLLISKWIYSLPFIVFLKVDQAKWAKIIQNWMHGSFKVIRYERTTLSLQKGGLGVIDLLLLGITSTFNFLKSGFSAIADLERFLAFNQDSGNKIIEYWSKAYLALKWKVKEGKCRYRTIHLQLNNVWVGKGLKFRAENLKFVKSLSSYQNLYNFWVKAQNLILPTQSLLMMRGILRERNVLCNMCKNQLEDQEHLFQSCTAVIPYLRNQKRFLVSDKGLEVNFGTLNIMEFRRNRRLKVIIIFYAIWKYRCASVFAMEQKTGLDNIFNDLLEKFIKLDCGRLSTAKLNKAWEYGDQESCR